MSARTRSLIKGISVLLVILAVLMEMRIVIIPSLVPYIFWLVVIAYGLFVIISR